MTLKASGQETFADDASGIRAREVIGKILELFLEV
jgi:hypothetical protein